MQGSSLHTLGADRKIERAVIDCVVRLDLRYMSTKVKTAILNEDIPLGAILTNHNVLRRIEPRWFLRFDESSPVLSWFACQTEGPLYGRLGTIYCNHEPAIEVLEIVTAV